MKLKTIIIDDEAINIDMLTNRIQKFCTQLEIIDTATSVAQGIEIINKHKPDLLFLDVEINDLTGFDLLHAINQPQLKVILCTAYEKYAIESYKHHVIGYMLKPISDLELIYFVNKVLQTHQNATIQHDTLNVHNRNFIEVIKTKDIIYLNAKGAYTEIVCVNNKKMTTSKSLGEIEQELNNQQFCRVHNSHIINLQYINKVSKTKNGTIELSNGESIPVSAARRNIVFQLLGI